ALQYVFEKAKLAKTYQLVKVPEQPLVWKVRFFRPLDPEEYLVCLSGGGKPLSLGVVLAEDAPGAQLTQRAAQDKVERYLKEEHPEMAPFQFDDVSEERLKNRTDWDFTYKVPKYKVGDADYKIVVSTVGHLVSNFDQGWELPDKWRWERSRKTLKDQLANYLVAAVGLMLLVAVLWWMIGVARSGAIRWRPAVLVAIGVTVLVLPQSLNDLPEFFVGYGTDTPLSSYFVAEAVRLVLKAVSSIGAFAALAAFGLASFRILFPRISVARLVRASLIADDKDNGFTKRNLWLDAVLVGYALGLGFLALHTLSTHVFALISPNLTVADQGAFCAMANVSSPALATIMTSVSRGVGFVVFAGVSAGLYAKYCRNFKVYLLLSVLFSLIYPCTARYWQDYLVNVLVYLAWCFMLWLMVAKLGRQNLVAYFLSGAIMEIATYIKLLQSHGADIFASDIVCLVLVALSPLIYLGAIYNSPPGFGLQKS
ncbi:MAG: hypothetical protein HY711_11810, partial [Candidatus Melainabacteria bacterium]|nr:hypothetical protein [Candidatus Melainabacteria bacterium]